MVKEKETITKKYLTDTFATKKYLDDNFATKKYLDENFVTKDYLKNELKEFKIEILREVRIMIHDTMISAMENMKLYYEERTSSLLIALRQGFRDDLQVYNDQFRTFMEKIDNHERRIVVLEDR